MPAPEEIAQAMPIAAQKDLMEWNNYNQPDILSYVKKISRTAGKTSMIF